MNDWKIPPTNVRRAGSPSRLTSGTPDIGRGKQKLSTALFLLSWILCSRRRQRSRQKWRTYTHELNWWLYMKTPTHTPDVWFILSMEEFYLEQYESMPSARADLHEFEITVMDKACFIFPTHPRSFEPSNLRNKARARFCQLVFFKTFLDSVTSRKELWSRGLRGQQQPNWNGERDDRTCNCEDMG